MPRTVPQGRLKQRALLVAKGFCIGAADVVPGVSGGTMAFILGIYRDAIAALKSFDLAALLALLRLDVRQALARPHFGFIIPLLLGIVAALLFFTRVVPLPQLLLDYPEQIYGLFFGLIAGSIAVLLRETGAFGVREWALLASGTLIGVITFNLVPMQTPDAAWFMFIAGALAICAMMLPGVSGSFVLLILNKYAYVFTAIGYFDIPALLPFAAGAVAGLIVFSRLLSWILERCYRATVVFITGLLLASLTVIWPFRQRVYDTDGGAQLLLGTSPALPSALSLPVLLSFVFIIAGISIVLFINRLSKSVSLR